MDSKSPKAGVALLISKWRSLVPGHAEDLGPDVSPVETQQPQWDDKWSPDVLLDGFEVRTYRMFDRPHLEEEPEGTLIATLVRAHESRRRRAILHIHGWNEYFYQPHLAQFWEDLGYDFYAIDLHRYGRSFQEGELFGYMDSVDDYYQELDAAIEVISADHSLLLLSGHSTGGLTACLYANDRPKTFAGVVLNSPWVDMQGSALFRALTPPIMKGLAVASPTMVIPQAENDLYGRTLHKDFYGEWDYDLRLKRNESYPVRPGWLRAVVRGHDRIAEGLHVDCPVLVATSTRSSDVREYCEEAMTSDLALNADRIAARAHQLGWHVTLVRLAGALHDVSMSRLDVRQRFFDEVRRWELSYVRGRVAQDKAAEAIAEAEAQEG
ncbi:MAG: alpha/beta hydrolase [Propionibacteriaceae bacterium]|jgi:alpha-beta hydrolase superfamily lysophospholipase|nr:alpha/beta hydrolase [Propionibacteriaceae bacterium]